jgi:hypothetical protein
MKLEIERFFRDLVDLSPEDRAEYLASHPVDERLL